MKKILASIVAALVCISALSVPAWHGIIKATQPDGSVILLQKHGDEFCHWVTDTSGRVLEKDKDGYWRPAESNTMQPLRKAAKARRQQFVRKLNSGTHIAVGQKRFLVILVEFSDTKFSSDTPQEDFHKMLNQQGYSENSATGSARDYYYDNSHGYFEPVFDVYGPITLANTKAYYGANDSNGNDAKATQAVYDGCVGLDSEIDFSQYDLNKDGTVDLVFMFYAGYGEADSDDEDSIWPHKYWLSAENLNLTLDGKKVDDYACTNELMGYGDLQGEMDGIGAACHEFGHAMGLPDFYDSDYDDNGLAAGMLFYSNMDAGNYNNNSRTPPYFTVLERILLGWLPEDSMLEFTSSGRVTLPSVDENVAYKIPTDTDGEFFVLECRNSKGWDKHLPSHGLTISHVDRSSRKVTVYDESVSAITLWNNWINYNGINENGSHPCYYVIPSADQTNRMFGYEYYAPYQQYYYNHDNDPKIPFPGSKGITTYTPVSWNGVKSEISLSDIAYSNEEVSFYVSVPSEELDYPVIANPGNGVYAVGDSFGFSLVQSEARPVASVAWFFDDEPVSGESIRLRAGSHNVEAVVTLVSGDIQTVTLDIKVQ